MPRPSHGHGAESARGFTLLEVVVVLVIVSLTSAIVFPRLTTMASSYEFASQRDSFEQTLNGLSYRAYRENDDRILQGTYTSAGRDETAKARRSGRTELAGNMRTRALIAEPREHLPPVTRRYADVPLPEGWEVVIEDPIYFRGSGYCTGGTVELSVGRLEYIYALRPPLCRAELLE
ncbi:MAG: prepilin-type N-terminal cleavage/methylation domain-containing protein [Rhodospirillaceae bacterium]